MGIASSGPSSGPSSEPELGDVAGTALLTLAMRAADACSPRPVLGDAFAAAALERSGARLPGYVDRGPNAEMIVSRARRLDVWTRAFLAENPGGQVLHLGCGLDARPLRVARPAGSRWVDVDQPEVIAQRRRVYDLPGDVETIPASVTDPGWWAGIDPDRRTLLLAEGLLMYVPGDEVHALIARALGHLRAGGTLAFDGVAPWMVGLTRASWFLRSHGLRFAWATDDLAARHPGLRAVDDVSLMSLLSGSPEPGGAGRAFYTLMSRTPPLRDALRLHRYRF